MVDSGNVIIVAAGGGGGGGGSHNRGWSTGGILMRTFTLI